MTGHFCAFNCYLFVYRVFAATIHGPSEGGVMANVINESNRQTGAVKWNRLETVSGD